MYRETADDLNRKFSETYVKYNGNLVFVHSFDTDKEGGTVNIIYNAVKSPSVRYSFDESRLEVILCESKVFNATNFKAIKHFPQTAVICCRIPRRQYQRSLSANNTSFTYPIRPLYELLGKGLNQPPVDFPLIEFLLNSVYPDLLSALDYLPKYKSVALNERFYILPSHVHPTQALLGSVGGGLIGTIDEDGSISLYHSMEYQEVTDYLTKTHQHFPVALCQMTQ